MTQHPLQGWPLEGNTKEIEGKKKNIRHLLCVITLEPLAINGIYKIFSHLGQAIVPSRISFSYHKGSLPLWQELRWSCQSTSDMVCYPWYQLALHKYSFFYGSAISLYHPLHVSATMFLGFFPSFVQSLQIFTPFCYEDHFFLFFLSHLHDP